MRYFIIRTLTRQSRESCILDRAPEGAEDSMHKLMFGDPVGGEFPHPASMYMDESNPGIKLSSLVSNTMSLLLVSRDVKETMASFVEKGIEFLPVIIYNHKKRIASDGYFIINPLGGFDCLDLKQSKIEYLDGNSSQIVGIDEFVFDSEKLEKVPHLFRIKEDKTKFVISETLLLKLKELRPSNIYLNEVKQNRDEAEVPIV